MDERHKLAYCFVPKVGSSNWLRTLIAVNSRNASIHPENVSFYDAHSKHGNYIRHLNSYARTEQQRILETYLKYLFVRNPYERLLSAYRSIFTHEPSIYDKHAERYRKVLAKLYRGKDYEKAAQDIHITFSEFLKYLTDPSIRYYDPLTIDDFRRKGALNPHWTSYFELCNPCLIEYDFIGKHETMNEDAAMVLSKADLHYVKFPNITETPYGRSAQYVQDFYDQVDSKIIESLAIMYNVDFDMFNYEKDAFVI